MRDVARNFQQLSSDLANGDVWIIFESQDSIILASRRLDPMQYVNAILLDRTDEPSPLLSIPLPFLCSLTGEDDHVNREGCPRSVIACHVVCRGVA